jgi:Ca2+-binding EF-hand superfamily protein
MDTRGRGHVTRAELTTWVKTSRVFPLLEADDVSMTADRLFDDIDRDLNGTLEFDEFVHFLENTQREQRLLDYASKHHLTCLPSSFRSTNSKQFQLPYIEAMLEKKIDQLTSKDGDRMRQILTMMKTQMQRSKGTTDSNNIVMYQRDFSLFLSMLGLFATRAQSDQLFAKYDVNGDGCLSLYEFITKAKAPDYPGLVENGEYDYREGRGKRQFEDLGGRPQPPVKTPAASLYEQSSEQLHERIRERIEQKSRTGTANSDSLARRKLFACFERSDKTKSGLISLKMFSDALEKDIGVVMGGAHIRALCKKYATNGMVDYPNLVSAIYPSDKQVMAQSFMKPRKNAGEESGPPSGRNSVGPGQNMVNVTGSYWATRELPNSLPPSNFQEFPPLSPTSSRGEAPAKVLTPKAKSVTPLRMTPKSGSPGPMKSISKIGSKAASRIGTGVGSRTMSRSGSAAVL